MDNRKTQPKRRHGRRILSGMLAVFMAAGTFLDFGPVIAQAKEPERANAATVTLMPSEYGKLSFSDSKDDVMDVTPGTNVTVTATPKEGYQVQYIATVDENEQTQELTLDGNSATFTADSSVNVTASYEEAEKISEGSERPLEMGVDESTGSKAETIEDYILKHADFSKIGNGKELTPVDMMAIAHTFVDGKILPNATLNKLWGVDKDGDGYSDNAEALLSQSDDTILLYRASEDAEYFVGKVGNEISHAKVTDWAGARNDMTGTAFDDIIYDDGTRLVYVPSKYQAVDENNKRTIYQTKLQLLYTVSDKDEASASTSINVDNDGVDGDIVENGEASGTYLNDVTEFTLAKDGETAENISADMIDSVIVNDVAYEAGSGMWSYDAETGKLAIQMSPATVDTVDVKMSDGLLKGIKRFFGGFKAEAAADISDIWTFNKKPAVGDSWIMSASSSYNVTSGGIRPIYPIGNDGDPKGNEAFVRAIVEGTGWSEDDLRESGGPGINIQWLTTIPAMTGTFGDNSFTISNSVAVSLGCAHIQVAYSPTTGGFIIGGGDNNDLVGQDTILIRVIGVTGDANEGTITFAVIVPTVQSQSGYGVYHVGWKVNGGKLKIRKDSASSCTNGSSLFDMTGAQYGVYRDAQCTDLVETLTVNDNTGWTNESGTLNTGRYYVKEIKAPKGYKLNKNVKPVDVAGGTTTSVELTDANMKEEPLFDPIEILIQKALKGSDKAGKVEGEIPNFAGIQFKVDYYNEFYDTMAEAERHTPTASAVFETDDKGQLKFVSVRPVSGTWPYKDEVKNENYIPLGTVVVKEHKLPENLKPYLIKSTAGQVFQVQEVVKDGVKSTKIVKKGDWPTIPVSDDETIGAYPNEQYTGSVTVHKASANSHKSDAEGDGDLEGIEYTIYNRSNKPIKYKGNEIAASSGEDGDANKVTTIKTKRHGDEVYAKAEGLPTGRYRIVETAGTPAWRKADWFKNFSISDGGPNDGKLDWEFKTPASGWNEDKPTTGSLEVIKKDENTQKSHPQGNATLEGVEYTITNVSLKRVYWNNAWFEVGGEVAKIYSKWDAAQNAYVARIDGLPYGTYKIAETKASTGYNHKPWETTETIHEDHVVIKRSNDNPPKRGGVSVTKADADWNTTNPQGDASLAGVKYNIVNKSKEPVTLPGNSKEYKKDEVVMTITAAWDEATKSYVATTGEKKLVYGDYEIVETESSVGYLNAGWKQKFSIREDGEMHYFDEPEDKPNVSGLKYHNRWNVNPVQRGGIIVGKADRETEQYFSLGEAHLDGAIFKIINRSEHAVYVNGKTYDVGADIMTIATKEMEYKGKKIYAATTGEKVLPYGTYEIMEIGSGVGYLYDKESKAYTKTVEIRADGEMKELIDPKKGEVVKNQVIREDFHFKKKQEDSMERMDNIPFLIESLTTGERHIVVTDENGTWHSTARDSENWAGIPHTQRTNSNDPTSPISNGALGVDENGEWYVKDASKLDCEAGTWFTGLPEDLTKWAADGKSYDVNGTNVKVRDDKRAFPYDTYRLQELRCPNNEGYGLIATTVTLHRYSSNHDGVGIDIDYGTLDDKRLSIGTTLTNKENGGKVAPANSEVTLTDTVTYENLVIGKKYTMKGELHRVSKKEADGEVTYVDEGVVAKAEKDFTPTKGSGRMTMDFTFKTDDMDKKFVVAFEYLTENGTVIAKHEDLEDENQTVSIPKIETTLQGDLGHMADASKEEITLVDTITYENFEIGKEYAATGTLMKKVTGEDGKVASEEVLDKDNKPITATTTFVALKESGTVDVVFKFSGVDMAGETIVAFEKVTHNGVEYAVHTDIEDENQTDSFPELDTFAVDGTDGNKELAEANGQSIKDAIKVEKLEDGYSYKLVGELHVRNAEGMDEGALKDKDDNPYTAEVSWDGNEKNQSMLFEGIDASKLGGKDIVVYQTLYGKKADDKDWTLLGKHDNILDADQSVHVPHVGTTLVTGQEIHESQVPEDGMVTLKDTVTCTNLIPGHAYAVVGTLHVQETLEDGTIKDGGEVKDKKQPVTAKVSFVAEKTEETVEVEFTFDAHGLEGKSVTAFESLYSSPSVEIPDEWKDLVDAEDTDANMDEPKDEWKVAVHEDIADMGQTVQFVDIATTLTNTDGNHEAQVPAGEDKTMTLTDVVVYHNLIPGREYTVTGTLHKQVVGEDGTVTDGGVVTKPATDVTPGDATLGETEKPDGTTAGETEKPDDTTSGETDVTQGDATTGETEKPAGEPVTATTTFVPTTPDGEVEVIFTFDASGLEGTTVVAFEEIRTDNIVFAVHADINDEPQSVHLVKIGTTALAENGLHEVQIPQGKDKTVTITDTVKYENVIPGTEYTVSGMLHIQAVGEDGSITDGGTVNDKDGNPVVGTATFTPEKPNGTVDVTFTFDASELDGHTVVAFETLSKDGKFVASHEDITDEEQAVSFVNIRTTATVDGSHETQVPSGKKKTVTVIDRVEYANLTPGTEYTMSGVLHKQNVDKKGNVKDGGEIKSTAKSIAFTPETPDGFIDLKFEVDASELEGQTVVAFEELSKDGVVIAVHTDITDESQSVHFVSIHTNALAENGTHMAQVTGDGKVTITDRVTYENLIPGVTYKLGGTLHVRDIDKKGNITDGGTVKLAKGKDVVSADDGKAADSTTVEKIFTPKTPNGAEDITFTFDASKLAGKTVVAFETLARDGKIVATHEDINDEAQSVHFVRIRTRASAKNGKNTMALPGGETTKVTDLVEYQNLVPGLEYTMIGEFHVKSLHGKGKAIDEGILADSKNKPIRAAVTFTPKTPNGSVTIDFEIPTKGLGNRTIVAFENLTYDKKVIATHADINDENQSITFTSKEKEPEKPKTPETPKTPEKPNTVPADTPLEIVKTGQKPFYLIFAMLGVVLMAGGGYFYFRKKRK